MNKCKKCGTEFEGKFCPECGTPWLNEEEKVCPMCKAVLKANAKFCSECGYSFETQSAPVPVAPQTLPVTQQPQKTGKSVTAGVRKLYAAASVLPAALLGAFSVLLFLFFLAPVAVTGGNLFGEKIPSMSYGNVYAGSNYAGMSFKGSITALIVFAALALFVSFLIAVSCAFCKLRDMRFTVAGKKIFLRNILTAVGYILFFALFLISCILMGQIADADGGLGLMKAGAAPILVLVFTLVCPLAALACAFAGGYLRKNYPALVEEREEKIAAKKPTKVETWFKKHKIWTAGISALLVVAIVVGVAVPVGLANRHNGTYYAYNGETEEYDTARYYKLLGGAWKNENGERGKITFDGEKVVLSYSPTDGADIAGSFAAQIEGTIKGDVLNIGGAVFAKGKHKHITDKSACDCGRFNLEVSLKEDNTYAIAGDGTFKGVDLVIPSYYLGKPITEIRRSAFSHRTELEHVAIDSGVTSIGSEAFYGCTGLANITIPDSVTSIGSEAFYCCSGLTEIQYGGTMEQWQAISKGYNWNAITGNYTVTCTNGTVDKWGM